MGSSDTLRYPTHQDSMMVLEYWLSEDWEGNWIRIGRVELQELPEEHKDNRISLKGGRDPFTVEQETEEWFATQIPYGRIFISGKGYLSTDVVKLLTEHNINVILADTYGSLTTAMHKVMSSPTATTYRIAQYNTFRNPDKV